MEEANGDALRLTLCLLAAAVLYQGAAAWGRAHPGPLWEKYGPWLEEHPTRAVAAVTAVLYLLTRGIRLPEGEGEA